LARWAERSGSGGRVVGRGGRETEEREGREESAWEESERAWEEIVGRAGREAVRDEERAASVSVCSGGREGRCGTDSASGTVG
jgi:hypothetical protein